MRVRSEIVLPIGALLAVLCVVVFGTIALLGRMAPAIGRIRGENLESIQAAEQMMAALLLASQDPEGAARSFHEGMGRARRNVTEEAEEPLLDRIERAGPGALRGADGDRQAAREAIAALAAVNHESTARADEQAQRLGRAGAWSAVILGLVATLFTVLAILRLSHSIVRPIEELCDAARAHQAGDPYRRVGTLRGAEELSLVARDLDALLDQTTLARPPARQGESAVESYRTALLHYLEHEPGATALVDERGVVLAANKKALGLLPRTGPLPHPGIGATVPEGVVALDANLWLVRLDELSTPE